MYTKNKLLLVLFLCDLIKFFNKCEHKYLVQWFSLHENRFGFLKEKIYIYIPATKLRNFGHKILPIQKTFWTTTDSARSCYIGFEPTVF